MERCERADDEDIRLLECPASVDPQQRIPLLIWITANADKGQLRPYRVRPLQGNHETHAEDRIDFGHELLSAQLEKVAIGKRAEALQEHYLLIF